MLTRCSESWGVADKLSQLLAQSEGATVVLSFADLARESGANSALLRDKEVFESLCTGIKAHHRKTLFIFVTDRSGADECRRLTNVVGEELHILDLPESRRSRAQAEAYLNCADQRLGLCGVCGRRGLCSAGSAERIHGGRGSPRV